MPEIILQYISLYAPFIKIGAPRNAAENFSPELKKVKKYCCHNRK
jgi:hypothetical protein